MVHEHADAPYPVGLQRPRRNWPTRRCTADKRDEISSSHVSTVITTFIAMPNHNRSRLGGEGEIAHNRPPMLIGPDVRDGS